jgi:hypothetical protein
VSKPPVRFDLTPLNSPISEIGIPLAAGTTAENVYPGGSAVFVAPGIALTATHVLEEFCERFQGAGLYDCGGKFDFTVQSRQVIQNGTRTVLWKVTDFWVAEPLDICVVGLSPREELPRDYVWRLPRLELIPPACGSAIAGFGFPRSQVTGKTHDGGAILKAFPTTTRGEVVTIHHEIRDTSSLPFPCFRTNARFDPAMSGGPVFNDSGKLCGIICSSIPPYLEEDDHISYASLIWPAMGIPINSSLRPDLSEGAFPLIQLADAGFMEVLSREKLSLPGQGDIRTIRLAYDRRDYSECTEE